MDTKRPSSTLGQLNYRVLCSSAIGLALAVLACSLPVSIDLGPPSDARGLSSADALYAEASISPDEALAAPSQDERAATLVLLGAPDAFTLQWQELEGETVRWEEWSYFDLASRFDFVDGELVWTLDIEPAADGSIYAHAFNPLDFEAGMSVAQIRAMLPNTALAEIPLQEADIPGGLLLAGDQILLGFDEDRLVYAQTYVLSPEQPLPYDAEWGGGAPGPPMQATATDTPDVWLLDTFDSPANSAAPMFGPEYMGFSVEGGAGVLVAHHPGILIAKYERSMVQDFAATLTMRVPRPQSAAGYGLIFRGKQEGPQLSEYYLLLVYRAADLVVLRRWNGENLTAVAQGPLPEVGDAPFSLHVEAAGRTVYVAVDQQPVLQVEDEILIGPGMLGLAIDAATAGDSAIFEELRVEVAHE